MKWRTVRIADVCDTGSGGTPARAEASRYFSGHIPWVKSGELREDVILDTEEHLTETGLNESAAKIVPAGALLVALYGATVGRIAILGVDAATNQAVCHIAPRTGEVDRRFLFHALRTRVPRWLAQRVGGAQPNISQQIIKDTEIPLPPLAEQKRIAAILDKADALRRKRQQALQLTEQFLRSTFLDMFGDPVANPKMWPESRLGTIADIQSGVTKGRQFNGRSTVSVPYMRVANVQDGHLVLDEVKNIDVLIEEVPRFRLAPGDVLLTEGGDFDKLGRGAVWRGEIDPCIHQNHIFRVRPMSGILLPEFLSALLASPRGKRYFLQAAKQTTGIATINKTQLSGFLALVPPFSLQERFETLVRRYGTFMGRISARFSIADDLFCSLVQRAFRGEL